MKIAELKTSLETGRYYSKSFIKSLELNLEKWRKLRVEKQKVKRNLNKDL